MVMTGAVAIISMVVFDVVVKSKRPRGEGSTGEIDGK